MQSFNGVLILTITVGTFQITRLLETDSLDSTRSCTCSVEDLQNQCSILENLRQDYDVDFELTMARLYAFKHFQSNWIRPVTLLLHIYHFQYQTFGMCIDLRISRMEKRYSHEMLSTVLTSIFTFDSGIF